MGAIRVTVFASSTSKTLTSYVEAASDLGTRLAKAGLVTVFGGGNAGCMGALSDAVLAAGGSVHGITHAKFVGSSGIDMEEASGAGIRLDIVRGDDDLSERKRRLIGAGHCLICLPGGVGTFDELFMAIAMVATNFRRMPIVVVNIDGYYDGTIAQLARAEREGMLRRPAADYVTFVQTPAEAVEWCLSSVDAQHTFTIDGLHEEGRCATVLAALDALPGMHSSAADAASGAVKVSGVLRVSAVLRALDTAGAAASWQGAVPLFGVDDGAPPSLSILPPYARGVALGTALGAAAALAVCAWLRSAGRG